MVLAMDDLRKIMEHLRGKAIKDNAQIFYLNLLYRYEYNEFHTKIEALGKILGLHRSQIYRFFDILCSRGLVIKKLSVKGKQCYGTSIRLVRWWLPADEQL